MHADPTDHAPPAGASSTDDDEAADPRTDVPLRARELWRVGGAIAAMALVVFGPGLRGAFVYDDHHQIVQNPLVQDPGATWQALTSDVWAFTGDASGAGSNYWRPLFVGWLILNSRLWGVEDAVGWHVTSLAAHILACVAAYALARLLGLGRVVAGGIAAVFAVHPTRVEAVTWVSSSHDPLCAAALCVSLAAVVAAPAMGNRRAVGGAVALVAYAVALGTKEIAVLFPAVVATTLWVRWPAGAAGRARGVLVGTLPFLALALAYWVARAAVLGYWSVRNPWSPGAAAVALSIPETLAFYLRQVVWPVGLGPVYPLRAVTPATAGWGSLVVPSVVAVAFAAAVVAVSRRDPRAAVGAAWLGATLAPVLNVGAFHPERIVQDRYLYLPLFGVLLVLGSTLAAARRRRSWPAVTFDRAVAAGTGAVVLALAALAMPYTRVWGSDLALWQRGVRTDPGSAFAWAQYGAFALQAGDAAEAGAAADRSLAIMPLTDAMILRADVAIHDQAWSRAEAALREVLAVYPDHLDAHERLAVALQNAGRLDDAAAALRAARTAVPAATCRLTTQLAVILYQADRKAEALAELEGVRDRVAGERSALCREGLFRLGQLYHDAGRAEDARGAFTAFLAASAPYHDARTRETRALAERYLAP
ncbi:hypothetical protein DCC79_15810 [bacterium]|nr:MAG: hypothetical protein DCC79_15810 [bacterium]